MDNKRKTKLVCVGWGIWDIVNKHLWNDVEGGIWTKRKDAIDAWNSWYGDDSYRWCRQRNEVIVMKLWGEVMPNDSQFIPLSMVCLLYP